MCIFRTIQAVNNEAHRSNPNRSKKLFDRKKNLIIKAMKDNDYDIKQDEKGNYIIFYSDQKYAFHFGF